MKSPLQRLHAESRFLATGTCALLLLAAAPVRALNIVLVYDDLGENPSWDRDGSKLMAVAREAAERWERLIPSAGTHTIDVSWSHLDSGQLGLWKFDPFGNNNIYFRSDTNWFIDPTPNDDSEFDFGDPLDFDSWGSLLAGTNPSSLWFDGADPPATLEVSRFGKGESGEASTDPDLLSTVLHEIGHDLGVAGDEFSGRYAIYPHHILGIAGVEVIEMNLEGSGFGEEHGHVAPPEALMSPALPSGRRVLPSAMDVLVAARDSNYTSVDLVRKFAGRSGDWGDSTDWIGGRVPDASDTVFIVHGGTTTLTGARTADSVSIGVTSTLDATGDLVIDHELRIGGAGKLKSAFGSEITAQTLDARFLSTIELTGGRLVLGGGMVAQHGKITGRGTIETNGTLRIDGLVDAVNTDLVFRGTGTLDLDRPAGESSMALLRARDGNLGLETSFTSDSYGEIEVYGGRNLTLLEDVTIPSGVRVHLHDTTGGPAIINSVSSDVDIVIRNLYVGDTNGVPGNAEIHSRNVTLENEAIVHGPLTLASGVLTTLRGGLDIYDGPAANGRLVQAGNITVEGGEVQISVDEFDWGNSTSTQTNYLKVGPGAELFIAGTSLGSSTNTFRGNLQLDSGVLHVNETTPWELAAKAGTTPGGTLAMINNGASPIVRGAPFTVRDILVASGGNAFLEADVTFASTATVVAFGASASLFLDGHTTIKGGTYTGLGSLVQRGDIDVTANATIATEEFAWGNSFGLDSHALTVKQGATLTVASPGTGDPDNQFRGLVRLEGGDLVVNTNAGWTLPASSLLQIPGSLQLHNNGTIPHLLGQPVTIGAGLSVTGGAAHIGCETLFLNTSQTNIAAGAALHMDGSTVYRGTFTGAGTLQHNGSALHTSSTPLTIPHLVQHGLLTAFSLSGESKIITQTLAFASGSETRVNSNLRISGAASVTTGATFNGSGILIVAGSLSGIGTIGVDLRNEGTLRPGASAGLISVSGDYTQANGTLEVEIGGTAVSAFDRLSITGSADLFGGLNLSLIGGFVPALGQTFQILTAPGGVSGSFTTLTQPAGMPANLAFSISYSATAVTLRVVSSAAYDAWINSFGTITDPSKKTKTADADDDGMTNLGEFATDGNPASGQSSGKVVVKIARVGDIEALTLTLPVRAGAVPDPADPAGGQLVLKKSSEFLTYTIQASTDMNKWTVDVTEVKDPDAANIQLGMPALNPGWVYRTFRGGDSVAGDNPGFMRAVISD